MESSVADLARLMRNRGTLVLSGAGISTESGIPDYRGPRGQLRGRTPMQYREFVGDEDSRRRYWARSAAGWSRVAAALPNDGHLAVARMELAGAVTGIITQNVDGLHQAAGSRHVLELHGTLALVRCLDCGQAEPRAGFQVRLLAANPGWAAPQPEAVAPDGDAELPADSERGLRVPICLRCSGLLKPDVVFFGESVPAERVERAWSMLAEAEVLLVLGSSLSVFSGYRFVERASRVGTPVAIVNQGTTRGDELASIRIEGRLGVILPELAAALRR